MSDRQSTADRFIDVMSEIRGMTKGVDNDHPHRYPIRCLQQEAGEILNDAITRAWRIADLVRVLKDELKKSAKQDA